MSEYTELPWRMRKSGISKCGLIYSQDDVLIAKVETHEDADMIVRAVNSHDDLLSACRESLAMIQRQSDFNDDGDGKMLDRLGAAIRKAEQL